MPDAALGQSVSIRSNAGYHQGEEKHREEGNDGFVVAKGAQD